MVGGEKNWRPCSQGLFRHIAYSFDSGGSVLIFKVSGFGPAARAWPAITGLVVLVSATSPALAAEGVPTSPAAGINWDKGTPEFVSADGQFSFRLKGRVMLDAATTSGSSHPLRNRSGDELRTLRLGFDGMVGDHLYYTFETDFAGDKPAVKGAYVAWRTPHSELTVGNRLSERGVEGSSSSDGTPFMERNAVASAIAPLKGFYGLGVIGKVYGRDWHLAAQVAGDDPGNRGVARDTVTYMVRGHWNPIKTRQAAVHLGAWGFYENYPSDLASLSRTTTWAGHVNDRLQVPLGALRDPVDGTGYGLELGGVAGPRWSFLEVGRREIETRTEHVEVEALSVSAGWMITGETPSYSPRGGTLTKVAPKSPLSKGGLGALEIAVRYQLLDNTDAATGGKGQEASVGLNWRLEEWMRLMVNLSHWEVDHKVGRYAGNDTGESLAGRVLVSF